MRGGEKMRICVTGGEGFIASHTIQLALSKHHEIASIDNESTGQTRVRGAKYYKGSITEQDFVSNVFREFKPEAVLHLAAQPSLQTSIERPQFDAKVNVIGTINIAKKAKDYGARMVLASTSAVYKEMYSGVYSECCPSEPINPYGCSKMAAENYVRILCDNWMILRYGNVFGPRQIPLGENQFIPRAIRFLIGMQPDFKIYGDGTQKRDFICVDDIARINLLALESKKNEILNAGTGIAIDINRIYEVIQSYSGETTEAPHGPAKSGELQTVTLNSDKAKEVLGWKTITVFEDEIRDTIAYWIVEKRRQCKGCPPIKG